MEFAQHLEALSAESRAFTVAVRATARSSPVPSCPDWMLEDLVRHLGRVHRWATAIVEQRAQERVRATDSGPGNDELVDWFDAGAAALREALERCGPEVPMWTWGPGGTSTWWARRQAHETAVHRWDAQSASGASQPIDGPAAADGVDEFLANLMAMLGFSEGVTVGGSGETIHLHCTDVDGEWLLRLDPDTVHVDRLHAKGDVAAKGTASALLLFACGRLGGERLEVFGDASLLARFQELARF